MKKDLKNKGDSKSPKRGTGRPKGLSSDERKQIEKDLMGHLDPELPLRSELPEAPADLLDRIKESMMTKHLRPVSKDEAEALYREQKILERSDKMVSKRIEALSKLGYTEDSSQKINTDQFLQKILHNVAKNKRRQIMYDAFERLEPIYAKLFVHNGSGWPGKKISSLLETPITENHRIFAREELKEEDGCISYAQAKKIAAFTLSWHKITSSPAMRGSLGNKIKQEKNEAQSKQDPSPARTEPIDHGVADSLSE